MKPFRKHVDAEEGHTVQLEASVGYPGSLWIYAAGGASLTPSQARKLAILLLTDADRIEKAAGKKK